LAHKTRIQLCGRLAVELAGRDVTPAVQAGHARVLFTFLAVNRERPVRRDELKEALWPGGQPAGADNALSALLSRLRRALGAATLDGRGELRMVLPRDAWVDLEAAEEAIHRAESAVAREEWAAGWGPSLVALLIARRGFLAGEEAPWAHERRRRLEAIRIEALECYAAVALGLGGSELAMGEKAARELVTASPYRERGHGLLMALLTARGNPAEALRLYETLRKRLREELGATPAPALREMQARLLRTGQLVGS
jgi:SARP family transcriptional regulator, regulator of embCAB operon